MDFAGGRMRLSSFWILKYIQRFPEQNQKLHDKDFTKPTHGLMIIRAWHSSGRSPDVTANDHINYTEFH